MTSPAYTFISALFNEHDNCAGYVAEQLETGSNSSTEYLGRHPLLKDFDHRHPWFIPADALPKDPAGNLVACFVGDAALQAETGEGASRPPSEKHALIAHDKLPAAGRWAYLLVDVSRGRTLPPYTLMGISTRTTIVATATQNRNDRDWAFANACSLSTGEYLLTRNAAEKKADTTRQRMLRLLALIANDADTAELDEIFRQETKLAYSLLRLVNSAAMAPRTPITSFAQAINLLGRRQLQRWLQLLIYADPDNAHQPNPLLYKAAVRGRIMESLAGNLERPSDLPEIADSAFMIGSFSLLDVLLNISMQEVVKQLPLAVSVHDALALHGGPLGKLLLALDAAERRNLAVAASTLAALNIEPDAFIDAQMQALNWAARIHPTN